MVYVSDKLALRTHQGDLIGILSRLSDGYQFEYVGSYDFDLPGLDRDKAVHTSSYIWPWFRNRVPNRKSPMFQRFADRLGLTPQDCEDDWTLVAKMGKKSIKDWFVLEEADSCPNTQGLADKLLRE
jgi:hypothetical protein